MTNDDVLHVYRLGVLASVRQLGSCGGSLPPARHPPLDLLPLEGAGRALRPRDPAPRERRRPPIPNSVPVLVEQRMVAFAVGHPGYGPVHIASGLQREKWRILRFSANGVWRVLRRHGIGTRALRYALLAGYAAPPEPAREPKPERHIEVSHPGELVQMDGFPASAALPAPRASCGRTRRSTPPVPSAGPSCTPRRATPTCASQAAWRGVWRANCVTQAGSASAFPQTTARSSATASSMPSLPTWASPTRSSAPADRSPTASSSACERTILDECWKPSFARYLVPKYMGLRRELERYLRLYNYDHTHNGRHTKGRIPAEVLGAAKMWR